MTLAYWLELIVDWLIARFGEQVLKWSVKQLVDYFRDHQDAGVQCQQACAQDWVEAQDDGTGPYFWERKN